MRGWELSIQSLRVGQKGRVYWGRGKGVVEEGLMPLTGLLQPRLLGSRPPSCSSRLGCGVHVTGREPGKAGNTCNQTDDWCNR